MAVPEDDKYLEDFRASVRASLKPLVDAFRVRIVSRPFGDAVQELERILSASERVVDEELGVLDQMLYEELSRRLNPDNPQA
jgi:hypothetical protein